MPHSDSLANIFIGRVLSLRKRFAVCLERFTTGGVNRGMYTYLLTALTDTFYFFQQCYCSLNVSRWSIFKRSTAQVPSFPIFPEEVKKFSFAFFLHVHQSTRESSDQQDYLFATNSEIVI